MRSPKGRKLIRIAAPVFGVGLILALTAIPAYALTPTITGIFPTNPAPGCSVTLTGSNFQLAANGGPVSSVTFTGQGAVGPSVVDSDGQLEVTVPAGVAASSATGVLVTNTTGPSAVFPFTTGAAGACPGAPTATPNTGAVGATITLTGAFGTAPTFVRFNTTLTSPVTSSSSIVTVLVPAGATTGPIHVYTATGESHTITAFVPSGTGTLPTITGLSPTCGSVGTAVTLTGTNLTGATSLRFNATTAVIGSNTGTSIATTVPTGATTGVVSVTTPSGSASSATSFTIPCAATTHGRTLSFSYSGHTAKGNVGVTDGFTQCQKFVPVYFQQKKNGSWSTLDTIATNGSGSYHGFVQSKSGKFRTLVKKQTLANGAVCGSHHSPTRNHG